MGDFVVQFLATSLLLYGLWVMGNRKLKGPFLAAVAEIFTTLVGTTHHAWGIVVIGVVLFVVQVRNFFLWQSQGLDW